MYCNVLLMYILLRWHNFNGSPHWVHQWDRVVRQVGRKMKLRRYVDDAGRQRSCVSRAPGLAVAREDWN
jgi:hypothetical protein